MQFYVDISRMTGCIFGVFAFEILDNWSGPGKKKSCSQRIVFREFVKFGSFQVILIHSKNGLKLYEVLVF